MTLQDPAVITAAIYVLGLATVTLSLLVAFSFMRESTKINKLGAKRMTSALAWQLVGEAAIVAGALAFAYAAHTGALAEWSILKQSTLRLSMFLATSATTAHLYLTIRRLR